MNELRQTLEDAFSAAPPDSDTRELIGKALDILDTIPSEPLEIMTKVERVKEDMKRWSQYKGESGYGEKLALSAALWLERLCVEFPE